jgi:hypothetical protein
LLRVVDHVLCAAAGVGEAQPPSDDGAVFDIFRTPDIDRGSRCGNRDRSDAPCAAHLLRLDIGRQDCSGAYPKSHGGTHIGTVKLAACCGGRGRIAKWDDNACLPQLRRPPISGRDHQPRSLAVVPLPAEPAHGRGDCWRRAAPSSATRMCGSGRSSSARNFANRIRRRLPCGC